MVRKLVVVVIVLLLVGVAAGAGYVYLTQNPPVTPPGTAPTVAATSPANAATGVAVNSSVTATFSEAMTASTITTSTFTVKQGTTAVTGVVTYAGVVATFNPASDFVANTTYTATVTTAAKDSSGQALAANYVWTFTTAPIPVIPDTTAPQVVSTSPVLAVAINSMVSATFSEPMNASTITAATFMVKLGTAAVAGTVTYATLTATFDPTGDLAGSSTYQATITTGVKDLAGNALQVDKVWSFTTGAAPDTTPPVVNFTSSPVAVPVGSDITVNFSEAMDPATISATTFTVMQGTTPVTGVVTYAGLTATFNPDSDFASTTTYTATITTGAKDLAGNAMASAHVWDFTSETVVVADTAPPLVTSTSPAAAAVDVALDSNVTATFNESMDPATISATTFTVMEGITPVSGVVSYAGLVATFDPATDFAANTTYTANVTIGVTDVAGNAMQSDFVWSFTSGVASACAQTAVDLGSAADFAVLAGSTVTNTGLTIITGDLGVSPGTAVTGFPPGIVVGTIHAGNVTAADAIANVTTAYNDAAGRTLCPIAVAGNLGGMTLTPGLYKSTSSLEISSGDLTLDALGDPNAVFIFQIASTLDVSAGLRVNLTGGAQSKNIFWQVGTSATFGTGAVFVGTILADQSITFATGVTLDGRAFARIAAVALDATIITKPSP